jgi:hypothetical protein
MLLGIDSDKNIKFIFTDEGYLKKKYPKNSAKVSDFWKFDHGLAEVFLSQDEFPDYRNWQNYKIIDGKVVKNAE